MCRGIKALLLISLGRARGCPVEAFVRALRAREKALKAPPGLGLPVGWVRPLLATANTWKGPIHDVERIVDRKSGDLVPFCWDGPVERVGPDRFRARKKGFRPTKEWTASFGPRPRA